ncbi:hypothetical protein TanjilG_30284 [Lupinus angustifolius]|uniref:Protein BIG GRAIN 1-like B n=1 Tax=Lupinus angustifolius TaxID=3871 RepID=A0A4P1R7F3_LUPAN|nr:PREDICTED: protein BIG GRAIN 1-like A [Lupinus angustifolius]OIW04008.1 hypothetical protein TanjilG_30284 [Lupinus angustifolius]
MHHSLDKKIPREERFLNPSFSSTLLDKIYRSIDEGDRKSSEIKFYRETTTTTTIAKKHSRSNNVKYNHRSTMVEEEHGKRKDKKVGMQQSCFLPTHGDDQDVLFFSSTSISSDTSSGGFSSSDTESIMSRASCFAPSKPKPVAKKKNNSNQKQAPTARTFDGFCHKSKTEGVEVHDENTLFKSKLRALKIYNNLKKVKQPISPGGRLTTFLNSLFANAKKSKSSSSCYYEEKEEDMKSERKLKSKSFSNCSSASSFSRSCLSKTSSSEREKMFNGVKRTVRFYPVSVIVDEENRPCGHKCLYEEEKIKLPVLEKSKVVEKDLVLKDLALRINKVNDHQQCKTTCVSENDDEDDDDAASYASSDLFELDHLAVLGNGRYCEELPVYETTHVSTNRAIANGLII